MKKNILTLLLLTAFVFVAKAQINIIPYPASVDITYGNFILDSTAQIVLLADDEYSNKFEIDEFNAWLLRVKGFSTSYSNSIKPNKKIIKVNNAFNFNEGYEMNIQPNSIEIRAAGSGVKNAFESLKQLIANSATKNEISIPCCYITDSASFAWRGMHLDVCRHFFDKEFVKKYIDLLAMYKMNVFHWHLTDDQGWRIEIKKYPKLTEIGAWRNGSMIGHYSENSFDTAHYGGFYTQEDIKEVVAYAEKKHVRIVPEIEMPGHAMAALAAYPQFSCNQNKIEVAQQWGVFDDVFCAKDETFQFLEDVLTEVFALFPGEYVHIGGDECPKTRWKTCEKCQARIKAEGLKDEHELQSYFIQRIEKFVNANGKKIIGWDEILEGGLAPNAAVMSWRGIEGGIAAARQKHNVVMTPGNYCYFDHYQGFPACEPLAIGGYTPIEKVYSFNPIPSELNTNEQHFIMGAQANLWTEYITSSEMVEYFALPRMAALAEVLWSPQENKNLNNFLTRLQPHMAYLQSQNLNCSNAIYNIDFNLKKDTLTAQYSLNLSNLLFDKNASQKDDYISYAINNQASQRYTQSIALSKSQSISAQYFRNNKAIGKSCLFNYTQHKAIGKQIQFKTEPSESYNKACLTDGLTGNHPRINNEWLGWSGKDMEATLNLADVNTISTIQIGFLQQEHDWIYLPEKVELFTSKNGKKFKPLHYTVEKTSQFGRVNYTFHFKSTAPKYLKIKATCLPSIPAGKAGEGNKAWLFVDEIMVE